MKLFRALLLATTLVTVNSALATNYSTEATIAFQKKEGTYTLDVRVCQLIEQGGKVTEKVIAQPSILTSPGIPTSCYSGLQTKDVDYATKENFSVDVSWPYPNESGVALCAVVIKRGDEVVSKSTFQLKIEGTGRTPLILSAQDVEPLQVLEEKSKVYLFVKFAGKTKEEVKRLANDNYGNKVQIRDSKGALTEGGQSFGTYQGTGMTVQYASKAEAEQAASILRAKNP